ncbi:MAG: hypothetical protein C4539_14280 [Ignavibacteriales bacterium]|nr:MAG: hypothetical protein C4539_14280 [Ignavibacteriales bacterium]
MKYKKILNSFLLVYFLLLIIGCKEKVIEYVEKETPTGNVQLSKNKVEIGEKIIVHFLNMDSVKVYSVTLNQKEVTFVQNNDSTLSLIVPYTYEGNDVGNFVFYCCMPSASSADTVLVSSQVNYKYEELGRVPYIKWNTNEKISENESMKFDGFSQKSWSLQTDNDTLKLIRSYLCHDECSIKETLAFIKNNDNELPQFLYALFQRNEWLKDPLSVRITSRCKISIDEWSSSSKYSGTFSADGYSWIFWYEN